MFRKAHVQYLCILLFLSDPTRLTAVLNSPIALNRPDLADSSEVIWNASEIGSETDADWNSLHRQKTVDGVRGVNLGRGDRVLKRKRFRI